MKKIFKSGFTLIELLVVVALITVLATFVLEQLDISRSKGADAGVKTNLDYVRPVMELYYANNGGTYGSWNTSLMGDCPIPPAVPPAPTSIFGNADVLKAIRAAYLATGATGLAPKCMANGTAYAIAVGMKTAGVSWCIDSRNVSKQVNTTVDLAINTGTVSCN